MRMKILELFLVFRLCQKTSLFENVRYAHFLMIMGNGSMKQAPLFQYRFVASYVIFCNIDTLLVIVNYYSL